MVNMTRTLESNGVLVLALPILLVGRYAFSAWVGEQSSTPIIVVPLGVSGDRLRFSLAHELGHLVLHASQRGFS